jgi:hypothetical protein
MAASWLRSLWWRWDAPDRSGWRAGTFVTVVVSWVGLAATVGVSVARWDLHPYLAPFLGAFTGSIVGGTVRHRRRERPSAAGQRPEVPSLAPSRHSDATDDPWRFPGR